jgi:hypothetical protein
MGPTGGLRLSGASDLLKQAHAKRDLARRCREVAPRLLMIDQRANLLEYAEALEREADELERQASGDWRPPVGGPIVTQRD